MLKFCRIILGLFANFSFKKGEDMFQRINLLFAQREIINNIVLKELKARYAGTFLGLLWSVVNPLLIMGVISFIFTNVIKTNIENFPLFVLSAILPWMCFSAALFDATLSITRNSCVLNQFPISREILPISVVLGNYLSFCLGLSVMLPIFIIFNYKILPLLLFLPVIILFQLFFTTGVGLLLSCLNVFFRDIAHFLEVILMFWFWMTPVFYSAQMVPQHFRWVLFVNPMSVYVGLYRNILFEAKIPQLDLLLLGFAIAAAVFLTGYVVFLKYEESFLKNM